MARDVAGIERVNMFETLIDPTTGKSFTPVRGTSRSVTYQVSDGTELTTCTARRSGAELGRNQAMQAEYPAMYGYRH